MIATNDVVARILALAPKTIHTPLGAGAQAFLGYGGRHDLFLREEGFGVVIEHRGRRDDRDRTYRHILMRTDDVDAIVPDLVAMMESWAPFLSFETLAVGETYTVLRELEGTQPGARLLLEEKKYAPHDGAWHALFRGDNNVLVALTEMSVAHGPILANLDLYLVSARSTA